MKIRRIFIWTITTAGVALLNGCGDELVNELEDISPCDLTKTVLFTTQEAVTRGAPINDTADLTTMGVYCLATGAADWSTTASANKMNNQKMIKASGSNVWKYDGKPVYWDAGTPTDKYSFFAYAPYETVDNGIRMLGVMDGKPSLLYTMPTDVTKQPDLMMAVPHYNLHPTSSPVALEVKHALTCVGFQIKGNSEKIAKISIENVYSQGYAVMDGSNIIWTTTGIANSINSVALNFDAGKNYYTCTPGMSVNLIAGNGYLMMIPQKLTDKAKVKITFSDGATKEIPLNSHIWEAGKRVTYQIDLNKLTISPKTTYGWGTLENEAGYIMNTHNGISGGTKKIVDALANFGEKANSVVKIKRYSAGETFKHSILSDRNVWYSVIDPVKVKAMFDTKPDIVLTGAYVDTSNPDIATYTLNYLKAGGVLILALQQESFAKTLFTKMYPAYTITTSGTGQNSYQIANTDDEITNGPFGNIMGKYWGNDWTNSIAVSGLPQSDIIVYSRNQEGYPIMFRHRTYNLIFIGDGGVFSNYNGTAGANAGSGSANIHPLAFDDNCKPITRTGWDTYWNTHPDRVENARLFANIMAWAVKQAETNGINRPK